MLVDKAGRPIFIIPGVKDINLFIMTDEERHYRIGITVFDQHQLPAGVRRFIGYLNNGMEVIQKQGIFIFLPCVFQIVEVVGKGVGILVVNLQFILRIPVYGDGIPFFCVVIDFRINRAAKLICYHLGFHFLQRDRGNAFSLTK